MRKILGDDPDLVLMANQEEELLKMFTQLMIEHKVGVTVSRTVAIVEIDENFFSEE